MIILSLVVRINFNDTDNSLYGAELIAPITMIKNGEFTLLQVIEWILLLIAHFVIFCLPFLTGRKYFKTLLLYAPLCFIIIYILYASIFILILLIPSDRALTTNSPGATKSGLIRPSYVGPRLLKEDK